MTNEEKILEMLSAMQTDITAMQTDITAIKEDMEELKAAHEETRSGVNALLEWAEECGNVIKFPLPKVR